MKIAVAGTGYVGLSLAVLLSQHNEVTAVDVIPEKVDKINKKISPIQDEYIEKYLAEKDLNLVATLDGAKAYKNAELVIIAAPTNYDPKKNFFDTNDLSVLSNKAVGSHRTLRRRYRQVSSLRSIRACGRRRNGENAIERRSEQSAGNAASGYRALNVCTKNHTELPTVARTTGKPI